MSGGSGSRLWPLSRESYPKQFLALAGEGSLFQQAALRASREDLFHAVTVVANVEHRFLIGEQLQAIGARVQAILLEPVARNTAAAVASAALHLSEIDPEALLLVMPADHLVADVEAFLAAVRLAASAAAGGSLALFGITPTAPLSAYGYIQPGDALGGEALEGAAAGGVRTVARFLEKPDAARAAELVGQGCLWNSGIFLLGARAYLEQLERFEPQVLACARQALADSRRDLDFIRLDAAALGPCPDISIDNAVMERTPCAAVVEVDMGWTDVGSWSALWDIGDKDAQGNVLVGPAISEASTGCYVRSEGPAVATLGVEDLIVIATGDAVLVTHKRADQMVKTAVARLRQANHAAATQTPRVHRPWGYYETVHQGERFNVKRMTINPGHKISLQRHYHRAEHWVVVNGTAEITLDGEVRLLRENESVFVPQGAVHRLHNPGRTPLHLIEVASGGYLGEDDIVRFEDLYARV
jgi:mannose-1-phosphate guanylyltransferase/mannose-1-phosphate guanylyltransferase/mannose-6-phosphate isomerase